MYLRLKLASWFQLSVYHQLLKIQLCRVQLVSSSLVMFLCDPQPAEIKQSIDWKEKNRDDSLTRDIVYI